jgi:flagellar motor switch protein FliM
MQSRTKPERIDTDQMRALEKLHGGLAQNFAAALSALLRASIDVKLLRIDQLTYSEFTFSLESPTCFNLLRVTPATGFWLLEMNPAILYPILDRMLGGGHETTPPARRPFTQIELRLVSRVTSLFLQELQRAWEGIIPLEPSVEKVESNPQLLHAVPPNEVVMLARFELVLNQSKGAMNLCIPLRSLEGIGNKLLNGDECGSAESGTVVELVACLAETKISGEDLANLRVGDIIATEQAVQAPLAVRIDGAIKYHARAGAFKQHKAVQIETALEDTNSAG